jgi:hypothetical protein
MIETIVRFLFIFMYASLYSFKLVLGVLKKSRKNLVDDRR